jgi:hypothetical protein
MSTLGSGPEVDIFYGIIQRMKITRTVLMACAVTAAANAQEADLDTLKTAEALGRQIYLHDHAAALVSDAVQPLITDMARKHLQGYITEEKGGAIVVTYFGASADAHLAAWYRAAVGPDGRLLGSVSQYEVPQALSEYEQQAAAARLTGMTYEFQPCTRNYNTVVLPKPGGWSVYLLPGTTESGVVPFGGTYRVDIDAAGAAIVGSRAFTKSCLTLPIRDKAVAVVVSHLLDPQPTEAHVFWQLWSRQPWHIVTVPSRSSWEIDKGRITFVRKIKDAD